VRAGHGSRPGRRAGAFHRVLLQFALFPSATRHQQRRGGSSNCLATATVRSVAVSVCMCVCVCVMVRTLNGAYTRRPRCCHYLIHYAASQTVAMQARIWLRYRGPVYETSEWGLTCPTLANIIGYFGYKSLQFIICTGTDNRT